MSDSEIIIHDHDSIIQLNEVLDYCGDSFLKVLKDVDVYLKDVLSSLDHHCNIIKEKYQQAERELKAAENALSDCEHSQTWDDESGCYCPSCDCERNNVRAGKEKYYDCKKKYEQACNIVSECRSAYKSEYKYLGGAVEPPGAERTLYYLAKDHTNKANVKMNKIIADIEDYLDISHNETKDNNSIPYDKINKFNKAVDIVKKKQKEDFPKTAIANVSKVCPKCKRPRPVCICGRNRENKIK